MHVHRIDFHATNISMKSLLYETRFCDAANVRFLSKQFHLLLVFVHKKEHLEQWFSTRGSRA